MADAVMKTKRVYYCQRCLNHGQRERRKNHKPTCVYGSCTCELCILVEKRRKLNSQLQELEDEPHSADATATDLNIAAKGGAGKDFSTSYQWHIISSFVIAENI
uniref:DM domain-containing protein n=1 Tax=Plectus sambesii TaxID=2011161 RepID=A0A914UQ49_9BILA